MDILVVQILKSVLWSDVIIVSILLKVVSASACALETTEQVDLGSLLGFRQ